MKDFLLSFFSSQPAPQGSREGMPYWIFWLLLCIILLLVAFIFLRDKELRQKLNSFFFRTKRKLIKIQLQARLKKEKKRKDEIIKELGKKTWKEGIRVEKSKKIERKLKNLEKNRIRFQKKLEEMDLKIETLNDELKESDQKANDKLQEQEERIRPLRERLLEINENHNLRKLDILQKQREIGDLKRNLKAVDKKIKEIEDNHALPENKKGAKRTELEERLKIERKRRETSLKLLRELRKERAGMEKERATLQDAIDDQERKVKEIEEARKEQKHRFQREIMEWEKSKEKIHEKLREIVKQKEPLFENLGKIIDRLRVNNEELVAFYSQIDSTDKRIREIERKVLNI